MCNNNNNNDSECAYWCCHFISVAVEKRLVEEVRKHDVLIIVGETGSGKTTRRLHFILVECLSQCYL